MKNTMSVTTNEIKQLNCDQVYKVIYENNGVSKQMIADRLGFSLPTISQNLNTLLDEQKIYCSSHKASTKGRPAYLYKFNSNSKVAISIELLTDKLNIAAVNLAGEILKEDSIELPFMDNPPYYETLGSWANRFINSIDCNPDQVLGVTIAIQGIPAPDGEKIIYGTLLKSDKFSRADFAKHLDYPVSLIHDAEAAGFAECWHLNRIPNDNRSAIYISLNTNLGSAIIIDGKEVHTNYLSSGVIEHLILHPGGALCYCGKRGCAEGYCSASALIKNSGLSLDTFFQNVRKGYYKDIAIWHSYLQDLALLIDNARMVCGGNIILGGLLSSYLTDDDFDYLKESVQAFTTFKYASFDITLGHYGDHATLIGTALTRITDYLVAEKLVG